MNCVNKKSKEFKKLVADYNVSENTMELLIHKYWREKRSEEDFPTRAYLNAHLGLIPYEETVDNVIKVWDKMYAHPITFKKRNDAYKAKKNALRLFPPQAVLLRLNDKGEYILTIRKPVKNLKAELDKIVGNGSFSTMSLNLHIDNSKKYPVNKLESLFNKFNSDRTSKALADKVFSLANSLDISVYFTDMKDENLGKYVPGKGIHLNKDFFSSLDNNERKANVILHETIHAICNYALSDVIKDENKSQTLLDFKNDITQIYDTVKSNKTLEGELGITNVKEFVAELSNPLFREKLQKIEDNNKTSLWQRIIDALKKLLNLHSSSDYYTRAMNTLNNALDAFDKNTYMEYNGILNELRESQNKNYQLSDKAKAFVDSLSEGELNDITGIINREISDFNLVAKDNQSKKNNQSSDNGKIYFTFNDGTQVEAPFVLNEQQANALNEMNRFIHSNETSMTLSGYAGTGKTSIMEMLRNRAWKAGKDVIFTASTNKAAAVLKSKVGNAMTLNKAFGISVEVNSKKKYNAKDLVTKIKKDNKIHPGSIIVIDEASMINEENYNTLNQIAQFMGAKIIYVGDSAQLAPVKETKVSKVFRDENGKTVTLTQVERTGDNAILREATDVRNGQGLSGISSFNSEGKGVAYVRPQQKKEIGDIVKHFLPQIKENPDNFKIIAFTNNKVALYNEAVRKNMGYNDNTPRVGESIMGYLNYGYRRGGSYDFINSQNYKVVHVSPTHENIIIVNGNTYKTLVNDVTLEGSDGEINTFTFTDVKQNQHNRQVAYILGKEVVRLWEDYRWRGVKDNLDKINAINSALFINDDIKEGERVIAPKVYDFGYAITAHKSQGSTFKNVLIDDVDIQTAKQSDVDLGVPTDSYDVADPSSMMPAGKVAINDVHDMNGATELNSTPFSLGEETSSEAKPVTKNIPDTISLVQQLEYVAISRATDTATIISNNVKKEGSPLHPEQSVKSDTTSNNNQHSALKEADVKYSEPPLKNRYVDKPFTTAREVSANLAGYFEGGGANIFRDFPNATEADVNRLENYYMGGKEYGLTDAQVVELGNKILGYNKINNNQNNITNGEYKATDEFRRVQEAVRGSSKEESSGRSVFTGYLTSDQRQRLANVLGRQLGSIDSFIHGSSRTVDNQKHGTSFKVHSKVNPQLFHDIFEVVRYYTKNAELVDLHDNYSNCKCFLTEDGTAGFAIEPDGNLVSVFNLGTTKGFLSAVKDMVREEGATHLDAYASSKQNLQLMYEKTLGFYTASTMDYNMGYDHDDIAKNHGNPQIVFMVDHEVAEPKHFDKDSYDAAQQYQLDQLKSKAEKQPTIPEQLISHLKSQGINVLNRDAMAEFLKTHKLEHLQQVIDNNNQSNTLSKLDEAIRTGNWTDEAVDTLEDLKIEEYGKILKRFSQEELRASNGILTQAASIIARGDGRADQKNPSTDSPRRAKRQEQQIESWAKKAGLWYNNYRESKDDSLESVIEADGGKLSDKSGSESMVYFMKNSYKDGVTKVIDASHYADSPQSLLDKIILHNSLFPETAYEVIGFGRDRGGTFRVIVKQRFVKGEKPTVKDIQKLTERLGLKKKGGWYYTADGKRISDLNSKNVIKTSNGGKAVIDCDVEFTKEYLQELSKESSQSISINQDAADLSFFIGKKARDKFEQSLRKQRPDMSDAEIESTLDFLHSLADDKENTAYIKTAVRWVANRSITLPQDNTKARQAFDLARKKHIDLQKYNTLGELINAPEMQPKEKEKQAFNPDTAKTFSNKQIVTTEGGRVFTTYDVENTEEGLREVCKALAAHYKMSPWCLSTFTSKGEPTESAKRYWKTYNAIPRKIAFENGKPVTFSSSNHKKEKTTKFFKGYEVAERGNLKVVARRRVPEQIAIEWLKKDLVYTFPLNSRNGYLQLTDKGKKEIVSKTEWLNPEAWWDMEDTHAQSSLSDSIVGKEKKESTLNLEDDVIGGELERVQNNQEYLDMVNQLPYGNDEIPLVLNDFHDEDFDLPFFTTPQGEVYGFVDKDGNIYLDETKISPEHPIHEYTHLWDKTVQQKNPKLWQRGVELMKQTSLWNEILNDENYGKLWQAQNFTQENLDNLIASEVHARFTGEGGVQLLEKLAKEKGQSNIIEKLKQWILDVWKDLKATFGNWSQEDIDKLTLKDFNHMTVRDFTDGINLKDVNNATYTPQQHNEPNKPIMPTLPEGPIKPSESQKVFLPGYEHFDREVKNGEQKGIEVDAEWKIPLLKELDSKIYNPSEEYEALGLKYDKDKQHERLNNEFCINQINVLLRRIHSKDDWNNLELKNKLIKEEYEQNQYDKLARQIDNLNNPMDKDGSKYFDTPLTSSEVKHAVEMAMDYASDIITKLQAEGEEYAKEINFDFQPKKGFDFKTASRQEVIEAVGLSNIFNAVHEWFNYTNDWCDTDEALDEAGNKMSFLHENWDAVMWMGAPFFNFNEGFGFKEQIGGTVERTQEDNQLPHDETYNKEDEEDVLVELFGEGREHYLVDSRTIDVLGSMSTTVKRAIHECYKLDEEGNPIVNRTWGLKERVSVKDATINILSWTQGAVTYEDMLAKISQKAKLKKNNWVNQLLIKLNDNSGQYTDFQSQFFSVFCKHRTTYTVAVDQNGKISSIPANKNPVLKQVIDAAKAKFNADETPLFNARKVNTSLLGNEETISDRYFFNLHKAYNELKTLDDSLNIRVNYQRQRKALTEEQLEEASETLAKVMQAVGFSFVKEEIEDILDESSLHQMTDALRIIIKEMSRANSYKTKNPDSNYEIAPFSYTSDNGVIGALRNLVRPITDVLEESNQNTVYDDGKLYQEFTIPSFLSKLFQKFNIKDENKFHEFIAEEYGKSEFFSLGHSFDTHYLREKYEWRLPWLNLMSNGNKHREHFDHRVNLSYKGKGYMKKMSDLDYAMSVLSQYWSMSSNMRDYTPSYFRMPMQSNKPTEDYIGFVAYRDKESYKKSIVEGRSSELGLYHMFLTELSRIQTVRMRNKDIKKDSSAIKNFDTNGRNFCFFKFLNPYLNGITHKGESMNLLAPKRVFDDNGNTIENYDDAKFAKLLQKKVKGEETLTSDEELELGKLAKSAIYNYLQDRFDDILDSWQVNGLVKAARNITNIAEHPSYIENTFDKNSQKAEYDEREKKIDSYIRSQLENFLWNDYFATKNILMLTVGDVAFYNDEEDLQKRLAQLHAPGVRGRVSAVDYKGNLVSDGKYRTVILKDFDKVKSNIIANISEVFDRKIAAAPDNMKAQWKALKENVLRAYSEINVADAEGYTCPTAYRKKAIMFGKWSKEAEAIYQKITKGENVDFTEIKQAFQPLKPFVYSHLQKPMGIDNAPITNMYCPFQAKNSEYLLVMADVLLRNENTSRPNLLKVIFNIMEDSAFDGRQRNEKGKITTQGTYNGKGIDTIQFESAIKSSLQGAVDIAQFADDLTEGEKKAKDELYKSIYKTDTESYNSSAYNTDVFVHELPFEDYCLQQEVPDHFKDHEQAHGSQTRMIIPSDLEEYYDENVSKDNPDNIVKYEYDEWQEITKGKWEKVHVSKTAKEVKEDYENTIYENIVTSLDSLVQELHLNASSKVEQNLALSKILQRELHSSSRYGIDLIQACTIDKVTGEFRIPKGDPIQCKRIEQLINSIIKNRVNKQLIPGGPIVQVSNFGVSRQLQIRFNDKKGNLLPTKEEYDSSKHEDLSYEDYCKKNQGGIAYFEVFAPAWSEELYRNFADEDGTIDVEALNDIDPDLLKLITYRIPTEDKCSIAPCKIVGFLPKEAGSTIMLPYELTSQDGSDFDIDKRYVMRKALNIVLDYKKIADELYKKVSEKKNYNEETSNKIKDDIDTFLKVINSDHAYTAKYLNGGKALINLYNDLKGNKEDWRKMYKTTRPKDRDMRNNKIIDISWAVLTNPTSSDKVLKPEGFDEQKKVGYMIAAYRNNPDISWEELEQIANSKDGIKNLKKLSYTEKDLAFFDTQLQFYKQNAAAASLIGVFAVNKIAHSILEGDGIYLTALGSSPFTIGHMQFKEKMELDPKFDTEGNNIGNVLGSLVGASADAVKDPILNLMNINMNTANILNALLRLGMSFKEAAMFLSQSIITKALAEFDKQNLDGYASIRNIVSNKVKEMNQKNHYTSDSNIVTEEISPEELEEGLLEGDHEALDYKVLIAFNKILDIADKLRNPTLVTRFNSIAGAVGPLTIDNLMTEYKLKNFTTLNKESTGFECQDKDGEWLPATFSTILEKHPILAGFYSTYGLANRMFSDTPAGSNGFNKVINSLGVLGGKIMGNRQLLNSLVNFYSTFLLVDSGLVDSSKLEYYIKNFPKEFSRIKDSGKYKNNKLVESIFLKEYSKSSTPALQVNLTGLDTLTKEELSSAWIDLYHDNKNLALKLFAYNVFKGGLEFSPKTFISLLPNYIKERIVKQLPDGKKLSYLDVFRKLDFSNVDPALVVDQFVRNNWDNNSLVPYVKITKDMLFQNNVVTIATDEDKAKVTDCPYIKMKIGDKLTLLKYDDKSPDKKVMHYKVIAPLGNNKEYLEMSVHDIIQPMSVVNQGNEELETSHISSDNLVADGTTTLIETFNQETSTQNESKKALDLAEMFMAYNSKYDRRKANEIIGNYKRNLKEFGKLFGPQINLLKGVFEKQGLQLNDKQVIEKFNELC